MGYRDIGALQQANGADIGALERVVAAAGITVEPSAITMTATVHAPTLTYDYKMTPSTLALTATCTAPTITFDYKITPSALGLTIAICTPTLTYDYKHIVSTLTLSTSLKTPVIDTGVAAIAYAFLLLKKGC